MGRPNYLLRIFKLSLIAAIVIGLASPVFAAKYVGAEKCLPCHGKEYNNWRSSGHPYKLRTAEEAKGAPIPLPEGYTWDDISYVIGGYKWKSRYMDKNGFIITKAGEKPGKNQYNFQTGEWVDYEAGKEKKYDCGSCHTTGYSKEGSQGGLKGIVGTWQISGISCEACHGPGGDHVAKEGDKALIKVDRSAALCGQCHVRGASDKIPASGGFIRHHEQYNEHLASPHGKLGCVSCHDPHKRADLSIKRDCGDCHFKQKTDFAGSKMEKVGLKCDDCHMPKATKSAVKIAKYEADVKTHLFRINIDAGASMFTEDGKFAKNFVTLDFACLNCHKDRDVKWAAGLAKRAHSLGK